MNRKNVYKIYRMFCRKILAGPTSGNIDTRFFAQEFTATHITFKGRTEEEALRKAKKFWINGQLGMGSFILKEE